MEENYCAFALAILRHCTPEQAFEYLEKGKRKYTDEDVANMKALRAEGFTYKQVGDMYGLSANTCFKRMNRRGMEH